MSAKIESLLHKPEQALDVSVLFTLLWLASCDGTLNSQETKFIEDQLPVGEVSQHKGLLLQIIEEADQSSFLFVFRHLTSMSEAEKNFLMELAVGLAAVDNGNKLSTAEYHILVFLMDLLGGGALKLKVLYKIVSNRELSEPGDPSSVRWWERHRQQAPDDRETGEHAIRDDIPKTRREALEILGLNESASSEEIKKVYKRKVQNYHPDRFESRGKHAQEQARQAFLRVRMAYEVLRK